MSCERSARRSTASAGTATWSPSTPTRSHPRSSNADHGVIVPHASSPDYIPALAELVSAHGVRAVLPLADLDNVELVGGRD